ncbi:MAG: hypothetical protein K0Q95_393 [Bacteroidota bacterium]|jgi:hypothetical protein|nr:hypothetical protein [Bacteroidota bacterium]
MKIEKIILQLSEKDFLLLTEQLIQTKADKFLTLFQSYRENKLSDKDIQQQLDIKTAAFYTLKSRLYDKVQEFLYKSTQDTRIELLQNVANIEYLLYKSPKETAIGLILKMEDELLKNDMSNELIIVYKALKKLHVYSSKFYDYQQLYNKFVAYTLAQDKAEELLSLFCKTLTIAYVTKEQKYYDLLSLYKKELQTLSRIHQSHRLTLHKNILNIHFSLFSNVQEETITDDTVEDMLKESFSIIERHPEDRTYIHLEHALNLLAFEYYHQLKLYKNASVYYGKLNDDNCSILLYNHSAFSMHFLVSRINWHYLNKTIDELNDNEELIYEPEPENASEFILFKQYKAYLSFYKGKIPEAVQTLNKLINEVSFKDVFYAEAEVKIFLTILLLLAEKSDQAEIILRSISRKLSDEDEPKYHTASLYIKFLKTVLANKSTGKQEKLSELYKLISANNTGPDSMLGNLHLSKDQIMKLSRF